MSLCWVTVYQFVGGLAFFLEKMPQNWVNVQRFNKVGLANPTLGPHWGLTSSAGGANPSPT